MDPRRKMDERFQLLDDTRVPFIRKARETALEAQPLGPPLEREIIVIRIDKAKLKFYLFMLAFSILIIVLGALFGGE